MKFSKNVVWVFVFILVSQLVFAGVTNPLPSVLNLEKGESGRFKFQVQTIASNQEVDCLFTLSDETVFDVEFDPSQVIVPAGVVQEVRGTVSVPRSLDYGSYAESFCISCSPTSGPSGTAVAIETCDLPIKVNVVSEKAEDNMFIPPKPIPLSQAVIVIVGLGVIAYLVYLWKKKKSGKKGSKKTTKRVSKKKITKKKK